MLCYFVENPGNTVPDLWHFIVDQLDNVREDRHNDLGKDLRSWAFNDCSKGQLADVPVYPVRAEQPVLDKREDGTNDIVLNCLSNVL